MSDTLFAYLEARPAKDAPVSDNPSGLYCADCRATGLWHCAYPEECGGMRRMKPQTNTPVIQHAPNDSTKEIA